MSALNTFVDIYRLVKETESIFAEALVMQFIVVAWIICMTVFKLVAVCMIFKLFNRENKALVITFYRLLLGENSISRIYHNDHLFGLYIDAVVFILLLWDTTNIWGQYKKLFSNSLKEVSDLATICKDVYDWLLWLHLT